MTPILDRIEFIPNTGYRLWSVDRKKSIIIGTIALFKPGKELNEKAIIEYTKIVMADNDMIFSRSLLPNRVLRVAQAQRDPLKNKVAYKFTDNVGLSHWGTGSIRLTPPAVYQNIENVAARDAREGHGTLFLNGLQQSAAMTMQSSFNSYVICMARDARKSERAEQHRKFGDRLIKISRVEEFADKLARSC